MPKSCLKGIAVAALVAGMSWIGCAKSNVRKEMMAMGPIVLPNAMCAQHGTVSMSADKEGERMVCELQPVLGSHVPRCVCVDEGFSDRERELALVQMRDLGMINPCFGVDNAAGCLMGGVGTSTSLGTR